MSPPTPLPPPPSDRAADYFKYLQTLAPAAVKVWASAGEAEFNAAVDGVLEQVMKAAQAEASRELLSRRLVRLLSAASVPCGAEEGPGGQVTVTVKHPAELAFTARRTLAPR